MNIFLLLTLAILVIIFMLRKHLPIGLCMLAGAILIWFVKSAQINYLLQAFTETISLPRTYDLLLALYFVMCLEIELRTSGALSGMVQTLQKLFSTPKVTLAVMPAFLGLLPSLGGARFSAPIVEEASSKLNLNSEHKAAINFWFRHIFEFSNPIIPGMIMACSIANVAYSDFIKHVAWLTILALIVGLVVLINPIKNTSPQTRIYKIKEQQFQDLFISLSPVILTFILVVFFNLNASISMGIVTAGLFLFLYFTKRPVNLKEVIIGAIDGKMFINIICILYFIQLLSVTNILTEIASTLQSSPLPIPVIIACISLIIGVLTGMSQGHVAIVMPIVAELGAGNLTLAGIAMAFGIAGQMLTPTHMCLIVTIDYFKANLFKTLKPIFLCEFIILTIFSLYTYINW